MQETWKGLEACVDKGLVRSIGVANFSTRKMEEIFKDVRIAPAVLQVKHAHNVLPLQLSPFLLGPQLPRLTKYYRPQRFSSKTHPHDYRDCSTCVHKAKFYIVNKLSW